MIKLICNGDEIYSYSKEFFPKVNIGETLLFEQAYPEATVLRGQYIVKSIRHTITKRGASDQTNTIIELDGIK